MANGALLLAESVLQAVVVGVGASDEDVSWDSEDEQLFAVKAPPAARRTNATHMSTALQKLGIMCPAKGSEVKVLTRGRAEVERKLALTRGRLADAERLLEEAKRDLTNSKSEIQDLKKERETSLGEVNRELTNARVLRHLARGTSYLHRTVTVQEPSPD